MGRLKMHRESVNSLGGWGRSIPLDDRPRAANLLLRVVDAGLCGVIFVAPYFFGGRHDVGRLVFVTLVSLTAIAWFAHQAIVPVARWPRTLGHVVLVLAAALLMFQIVPLPASWIETISPRTFELLPLWSPSAGNAGLGTWQTISLTPHETTKALAMLLSYGLLFVVVTVRIKDATDVARLLNWIAASAVLMATFALLQAFTSDGHFFWFYDHPHRTVGQILTGPFINRNHLANFLVLGVGPLVALWLQITKQPDATVHHPAATTLSKKLIAVWGTAALIALVLCAILLTRSRGGAAVLLVAGAVLVATYFYRGLVDSRFAYGLIGLAVVVVGMLSVHGYDDVARRLDDFTEGSMDEMDNQGIRRKLWTANLDAIHAGWLTGSGVGSHGEIYPVYLPESITKEYEHADNCYLQVGTETGIVGVVLLAASMLICGTWMVTCLRYARGDDVRLFGAVAAGIVASAIHAIVDFAWYVPACMSITVILAGCLLCLSQLVRSAENQPFGVAILPRGRWLELATAVVLVAIWNIHTYVGPAIAAVHWDRYLRASVANSRMSQSHMTALVAGNTATESDDQRSLNQTMLRELQEVVRWNPQHARAHLRLAARCIAEFEILQQSADNAMGLAQVRDAAVSSGFTSRDELHAWLERAFGANIRWLERAAVEARLAVTLSPLQGEAYVYLAQLSFLEANQTAPSAARLVDQATRARPYDADVLFEIGFQEYLTNNVPAALEQWKKCFGHSGPHQRKIVYLLAGRVPAAMFLSSLQPDWRTLREIWTRYRNAGASEELETLLTYAAEAAQRESQIKGGIPPAHIWFWQSQFYADVGRSDNALACLERAYACDSRPYFVRCALANQLRKAGRYTEAEPHYRWCLARRPADKALANALVAISKQRRLAQREKPASYVPYSSPYAQQTGATSLNSSAGFRATQP